jgi:hypothetical protein
MTGEAYKEPMLRSVLCACVVVIGEGVVVGCGGSSSKPLPPSMAALARTFIQHGHPLPPSYSDLVHYGWRVDPSRSHCTARDTGTLGEGGPRKGTPRDPRGVLPLLLHWHPGKRRRPGSTHPSAQDASGVVRGLALRSTVGALLHRERTTCLAHWRGAGRQPVFTMTSRTARPGRAPCTVQGSFRNTGPTHAPVA